MITTAQIIAAFSRLHEQNAVKADALCAKLVLDMDTETLTIAGRDSTPDERFNIVTSLLSFEFAHLLEQHLGPIKFIEVLELNIADRDHRVCHSHDFCDANEVMDEAFLNVLGARASDTSIEEGCMNDEDLNLWNDAWAIFRKTGGT